VEFGLLPALLLDFGSAGFQWSHAVGDGAMSMTSTTSLPVPPSSNVLARSWARGADYLELTKPRIAVLVLVTVAMSSYIASWGQPDWYLVWHTLLGTALIAASSSAANQWLERHSDGHMRRTAGRPLPAGRLRGSQVLGFTLLTLVAGTWYLAAAVNWVVAGWGLLTWALYVCVYTPLKPVSPWNTGIGAVGGALPIIIGWTAVGAPLTWRAAALFGLLFLWQFPHFMAIAWIYREQYRRAGLRMQTVVDPTGRSAGLHAVLASLAMLPISFAPALVQRDLQAFVYLAGALALGFGLVLCSLLFLITREDRAARILLRATLLYLPAILALMMLTL
jgi:heme o synthase